MNNLLFRFIVSDHFHSIFIIIIIFDDEPFYTFSLPNEHAAKVSKVEQRTKFPFLWKDTIEGRAKRSVLKQNKPWLVNSFNAHKNTITKIAFIEGSEVLVTASADYSVRLWTIQGNSQNF